MPPADRHCTHCGQLTSDPRICDTCLTIAPLAPREASRFTGLLFILALLAGVLLLLSIAALVAVNATLL